MPSFDDKTIALAHVYSEAMLLLARQEGAEENLLQELRELTELSEQDVTFQDFLYHPMVDIERRAESIERMFRQRASDLLVDSLQVLNRKQRLALLPAIAEAYRQDLHQLRNQLDVHLTSAVPLSEAQREKIRTAVQKTMGREAQLVENINESLLGGMVVQIGDRKADTSVATQLKTLSEALLARASRQILSGTHVENEG